MLSDFEAVTDEDVILSSSTDEYKKMLHVNRDVVGRSKQCSGLFASSETASIQTYFSWCLSK